LGRAGSRTCLARHIRKHIFKVLERCDRCICISTCLIRDLGEDFGVAVVIAASLGIGKVGGFRKIQALQQVRTKAADIGNFYREALGKFVL
jgi:hypothetical protein